MPATTAFPPIDLSGVTERPLAEILRHDTETPVFNAILRIKDRPVSVTKLKRTKWPVVTTVEPEAPADEPAPETPESAPEPESAPTPDPAPEATPSAQE